MRRTRRPRGPGAGQWHAERPPDHVATEHRILAALEDDEREDLAEMLRKLLESLGPA
ncbi:hypothetical protein [Amycolatopsis sp. cmx-8-4]|uniref:hypothetical protein n=1 Tax=Amycolatopsis sp. cmx-8-4 TaxID=2790947 RepID=UPI0039786076